MNRNALSSVLVAVVLATAPAALAADMDPLAPRAPESAKAEKNPVAAAPESVSMGGELYEEVGCSGCHGAEGKGTGPASAGLEPPPRDFTDPTWQAARMDGELKYTIFNGSDGTAMIPNEAMFSDPEEVWHVINYIRSLKGS